MLTWEKIFWETSAASLTISNLLATLFVIAFAVARARRRDWGVPRASLTLGGFGLCFLAVYLAGYFDLSTSQALTYWLRGLGSWLAHFLFLVFGTAHIVRYGRPLYLRALRWFMAGIVVNACYGVAQLGLQVVAGVNLDQLVVGPVTAGQGKTSGINLFGRIGGTQSIYRVNALTGDPNHLGVILCVPLLTLLPYYLADRRRRRPLGLVLLFLLGVQALTLSRSGALGDVVGLVVLLPIVRHRLPRLRTLALGGLAVAAVLGAVYLSSHFVQRVVAVRASLGGSGTSRHFQFYELVPPALDPHPLFGMGFNTFAVFYQFVTGDANFGPHSFWIATLVETGMVGLVVYLGYFAYLTANADALRASPDRDAAALGLGLVAALLGTAAANFFYLTMQFDYFFAVALLAVAGAALFAQPRRTAARVAPGAAPPPAPARPEA